MTPRTMWVLGLVGAGVVGVVAVAALAGGTSMAAPNTPPAPPGPTPAKCPTPAPGTVTGHAPVNYAAGYPQTGTTLVMDVGDVLTVTLLRTGSAPWIIQEDDPTIVIASQNTTQPDPNSGGTDDVSVFTAVGPGMTTIRGSGNGTFTLIVKVMCP